MVNVVLTGAGKTSNVHLQSALKEGKVPINQIWVWFLLYLLTSIHTGRIFYFNFNIVDWLNAFALDIFFPFVRFCVWMCVLLCWESDLLSIIIGHVEETLLTHPTWTTDWVSSPFVALYFWLGRWFFRPLFSPLSLTFLMVPNPNVSYA